MSDYTIKREVDGYVLEFTAPSVLEAVGMFEEVVECEERRPNAQIREPYGARNGGITDDD